MDQRLRTLTVCLVDPVQLLAPKWWLKPFGNSVPWDLMASSLLGYQVYKQYTDKHAGKKPIQTDKITFYSLKLRLIHFRSFLLTAPPDMQLMLVWNGF